MENKYLLKSNFDILIEEIKKKQPAYGKLTVELIFHQNFLSKAIIIEKVDSVIFERAGENNDD